jgi:ATP-dependent exoDNAse (exonuclease V) alpha subunit
MLRMERETMQRMQEGNRAALGNAPLTDARTRIETMERRPQLNPAQRTVADQIFASQEKIVGLDGVAGACKTTTLAVIREGVEANGCKVEGFAPTSRAAQQLSGAGIETSTLQAHLAKGQQADTGEKRFYVLDESSLASTKQMHDFVSRLPLTGRTSAVRQIPDAGGVHPSLP